MAKEKGSAAGPPWAVECTFLTSAVSANDLPAAGFPEVAFAGRSNVGKSTLLNALVGRKKMAKTSNTPGRTRMLNYFHLTGDSLGGECYLVDMPGYGYARAAKGQVRRWTGLIKDYMRGRASLRRLFLLIDARRGLMKSDREILELLQKAAVSTLVVATKIDKLKVEEREPAMEKLRKDLKPYVIVHPDILATSAVKNIGIDDLRDAIADACKG
ncbi:MAG: YihA family ribosome biogenesis GTP-binding protein [Proteobacteria bacterium]|nr:YihA family ribosome biogenesis GTP-binding protein [Pseudomonadota bacterium]